MRFLFLVVFLFSCVERNSSIPESEFLETEKEDKITEEAWVCYHPDTVFHNKKCVEEEYPEGCYVSGDTNKFCWLLTLEDCKSINEKALLEVCSELGYYVNDF